MVIYCMGTNFLGRETFISIELSIYFYYVEKKRKEKKKTISI